MNRPFTSMDAVALEQSVEAEIHDILTRLKPDTKKAAYQILDGLGFEDYEDVVYDWAQAQYDAGTPFQHEEWEYRWWADEPRGCRAEAACA